MKSLGKREKLFCLNYAHLGNGREAAARSGYLLNPDATAAKLLSKKEILQEIEALTQSKKALSQEAAVGLKRLAFGSVTDALRLIYCEEAPTVEELAQMDLFNVAEIKRPKSGGIEIKFFDRLKPLERLAEISEQQTLNSALPFYEALNKGAAAVSGSVSNE